MNEQNYNNGIDVKSILTDDETILWHGKPNKKSFLIKFILKQFGAILVIGIILGTTFLFTYLSSSILFVIGGFIIIIPYIIQSIKYIKKIFGVKNIEYVVTDKRVLYKSGIIGMDYNSLSYKDVSKVTINVGILDKIFKDGSISLIGSNSSIDIHCISDCYDLYKKLYKIVLDIQTDIEYPNALRPDENPGYNTKKEKE